MSRINYIGKYTRKTGWGYTFFKKKKNFWGRYGWLFLNFSESQEKNLSSFNWKAKHLPARNRACCVCVDCSVSSDSLWPHGLLPSRLLCPRNSWGQNTGVDSLQRIFFRGSSQPMDWTPVSHTAGGLFTSWATREAHGTESLCCTPETQSCKLTIYFNLKNSYWKKSLQDWKAYHNYEHSFKRQTKEHTDIIRVCEHTEQVCISLPAHCSSEKWWSCGWGFPGVPVIAPDDSRHLHRSPETHQPPQCLLLSFFFLAFQ